MPMMKTRGPVDELTVANNMTNTEVEIKSS